MDSQGERNVAGGSLRRVRLFELDFIDSPTVEPIVEELLGLTPTAPGVSPAPLVVTPNVDQLVHIDRGTDAVATSVIQRATYVLPDGQPIVWASRFLGARLSARHSGATVVAALWPRLLDEGRPVMIVASSERIATLASAESEKVHVIVAPHLSLSDRPALDRFVHETVELIRRTRPTHVFVTLGFPKRCNVIDGIERRLTEANEPIPVLLAIGASFEMYYGLVRRAPNWVQRAGLEWFFRFVQEPRRLFRRYFVDDPWFVTLVYREHRARRSSP